MSVSVIVIVVVVVIFFVVAGVVISYVWSLPVFSTTDPHEELLVSAVAIDVWDPRRVSQRGWAVE